MGSLLRLAVCKPPTMLFLPKVINTKTKVNISIYHMANLWRIADFFGINMIRLFTGKPS